MLDSIRIRLTLWYTGVLALVLVVLFVITYLVFLRSVEGRMDADLSELSDAFLVTVRAELDDKSAPDPFKAAVRVAIVEHHFPEDVFVIVDTAGKIVLSSLEVLPPDPSRRSPPANLLESASFQQFLNGASLAERFFDKVKGARNGYRGF